MRKVIGLAVLLLCVAIAQAQESQESDGPKPDRWRGLVLNQSTPEDAIGVLGQPKKDVVGTISSIAIKNWLTTKCKEKIFRNMEFSKPEGIDRGGSFIPRRQAHYDNAGPQEGGFPRRSR